MLSIAPILALSLTTCGGAIFSNAPVKNCPVARDYSRGELTRGAEELDALGPSSELAVMMGDYRDLRRQARDCWDK